MRKETKELVRNYNRKCRKAEWRITDLAEDQQRPYHETSSPRD